MRKTHLALEYEKAGELIILPVCVAAILNDPFIAEAAAASTAQLRDGTDIGASVGDWKAQPAT
jgi:hypothetical protein